MKLVIDIAEKDILWAHNYFHPLLKSEKVNCENLAALIISGIPLDSVIEAIKAEIKDEAEFAYADFERYKVEYLGQDWEDAYDSLPQDDYRYGMRRALEIICKHISGKEEE